MFGETGMWRRKGKETSGALPIESLHAQSMHVWDLGDQLRNDADVNPDVLVDVCRYVRASDAEHPDELGEAFRVFVAEEV